MRVNLVNVNLYQRDAVGKTLLAQLRYFRRHGHAVKVYVTAEPNVDDAGLRDLVCVTDPEKLLADRESDFWKADLHVIHYPVYYSLLENLYLLKQSRVVLDFHNVTPPELWDQDPAVVSELALSRTAIKHILPFADLIAVHSPYSMEDLVAHGADPSKLRLMPYAVDLARFAPRPKSALLMRKHGIDNRPVMLFVGRIAPNKRVDLLVDALVLVCKRLPGAVLLIVGDHVGHPSFRSQAQQCLSMADRLGVRDGVIFVGQVPDDALPSYFNLADVYVSASLHEGFGIPLIEAMASGVPVVASDATAHPWVVGDAGLLVRAGDADACRDERHRDERRFVQYLRFSRNSVNSVVYSCFVRSRKRRTRGVFQVSYAR